jgi:hypothetical protein
MPDEAPEYVYTDDHGRTHRVTVEQVRRAWIIYDDDGTTKTPVDAVRNARDGERLAHGLASEYAVHRDRRTRSAA